MQSEYKPIECDPSKFADRKGPRFSRRQFRQKIISKELYTKWIALTGLTASFTDFKRIWRHIADELQLGAMTEPNGILLPHGIGEIYLGYVRTKGMPIDYKLSRQTNSIIFHENYHSYGRTGKIIYHACGKYSFNTCTLWNFTPITPFKEKATRAFQDNPELYRNSRQKIYYATTNSSDRSTNIPAEESS